MPKIVKFGVGEYTGPAGPSSLRDVDQYMIERSGAGEAIVYKKRDAVPQVWTIGYDNWTDAMKSAFDAFWAAQNGPATTWNYTHTDGVVYVARFLDVALAWRRENSRLWGITLQLEIGGVGGGGSS